MPLNVIRLYVLLVVCYVIVCRSVAERHAKVSVVASHAVQQVSGRPIHFSTGHKLGVYYCFCTYY